MADGVDDDITVTDSVTQPAEDAAGTTVTEQAPAARNSTGPAGADSADADLDAPDAVSGSDPSDTERSDTEESDAEESDSAESDTAESGTAESAGDEDAASDDDDDADDDDESDPLDLEGEVAADYLEELLDIADLDGDIDTYVENGRAHVSVITESNVLVGADGEVLEALQELVRLAVITETGNRSRLMLDIAGYRDRRRQALTELATDAVQEAKETGAAVRLAPMNPFERKIVHDVVADAGLTSESEGEEPQRRVVIQPSA